MKKELTVIFDGLKDPRSERNQHHPFLSIISIALIGSLAGITTYSGLADWAALKKNDLSKIIDLPNGTPSHDTFQRFFDSLDADQFISCFITFTKILAEKISKKSGPRVLAFDGKKIRNSGNELLCIVSAWSEANNLVLGHAKSDNGNEKAAIFTLLELLDVYGTIITIDAVGCYRDICEQIVNREADYVIAIKANQANLFKDIKLYFEKIDKMIFWEEESRGHGRIEKRTSYATEDIEELKKKHNWPTLKSIVMVTSQRTKNNKTTIENRYYITSLPANPEEICRIARSHWGIENKLHWRLDVIYNQDKACIRNDNAVQNMDTMHKWALNILSPFKGKGSIKGLQRKCSYSFEFLFNILQKIFHA